MTLGALFPPTSFALLAAGVGEWIVPLVVFVVWIINQVLAANKPKPGAPKPPQPPIPPAGRQPQAGRQGQGGLVDEVERFLQEARKAMKPEQRPKPLPRPVAAKQGGRGIQRPPKVPSQRKPQPQARQSLADRSTLKPQAADRELDDRDLGGSVSQHVQQHLDTSRFDERAGKLSQLRQEVDRDIAGQVARTFDHQVGTLGGEASGTAPTADVAVNPAAQLLAMLSDPASMRNAIILQEILTPPTSRW